MEWKDLQDLLVQQVLKVPQDPQVLLEPLEELGLPVPLEQLVGLDQLGQRVQVVNKDQLDQRVQLGPPVV